MWMVAGGGGLASRPSSEAAEGGNGRGCHCHRLGRDLRGRERRSQSKKDGRELGRIADRREVG